MKYQQILTQIYSRLDRLGDLPVFSATVNRIQQISSSRESDAMALAMVVMKDANLSAKLLKVANAPGYNRGQGPIQVVSRAVVLLGFDRIKSLSVTLKLIESFGQHHPDVDISGLLMRAFLNGALVRELAQQCGGRDIEQTYLCGLLHNLGEIVVAYTQPSLYCRLLQLRQARGERWESLQLRALGGHFSDVGQDLAKSWGFPKSVVLTMDALTAEQLKGDGRFNHRLVSTAGQLLERLHGQAGEHEPGYGELLEHLKRETGIAPQQLEQSIESAYRLVCDLSLEYGLPIAPLVPPLDPGDTEAAEFNRRMAFYLHSRAESHRPPDTEAGGGRPPPRVDRERQARQLDYLQELGELLGAAAPPQQVLRKVVEAVVESTGCDRAALCLLSQNGRQLAVRLLDGEEPEALSGYFELQRGQGESDFFFRLLEQGSTLLVADLDLGDWRRRLPAGFLERVRPQGFILSPLQAGQRTIGCLYADRLQGNEAVSDDDFRAFNRFFLQARLALSVGAASAAKGSSANGDFSRHQGHSNRGGSPTHS